MLVPGYYLQIPWYFFETEICEHNLFHTVRESSRSKFNVRKTNEESMDKVESNEEALDVEKYEAFIKIREMSDPGPLTIIFGLVFLFLMPIIIFVSFPLDQYFDSGGTGLCCGNILLGLTLLVMGAFQSSAHDSSYHKAAQDLAHHLQIPVHMVNRLPQLEENSNKSKLRKFILSQHEEE